MSKTEKIVCAVTLIALGGLWFATEGNVWGLMMVGAGALMALSLKAPAKAENPLYGQDGIPKGFESKYQKWMKENPGSRRSSFHDDEYSHIGISSSNWIRTDDMWDDD